MDDALASKHVAVGYDGTRRADKALDAAVALARGAHARLSVISLAAVEAPAKCCNVQTTFWNAEMRRLAAESADRAREAVGGGVEAEFIIRDGRGAAAVQEIASDLGCDVVVAANRRGRVVTTPLGSTGG